LEFLWHDAHAMAAPEITTIEQKLEQVVVDLKKTNDPERKRALLKQMRTLMAELDEFVFDHTRFPLG
jgi:uncharacterized membrane-anchored protein